MLRLNASIPTCGLLGSHDDLSALQYLPTETAVVTQLRLLLTCCHSAIDIRSCQLELYVLKAAHKCDVLSAEIPLTVF